MTDVVGAVDDGWNGGVGAEACRGRGVVGVKEAEERGGLGGGGADDDDEDIEM